MKVLTISLIIVLLGCSDSKELKLQKFLLKGNLALTERNKEEAIRFFNEALKVDRCFADALNNLGTIYFQEANWNRALEYYNRAITCRQDFLAAYFNRANTYYELKEYFNAIRDVQYIKHQRPDTAVVYFVEGLIATKMRDFNTALASFDHAVQLDTANVDYLVNRGTVKYYLKQWDDAEKDLLAAAQRNDKEPNIYNTLALIETGRGHLDRAMERIEKSLTLSPDHPYYLNNRGYIHLMANRKKEALVDIDKSIELDPGNGWAYRNKGIYYLMEGKTEEALRLLKQAITLDSFVEKCHFYLGVAYQRLSMKKEACQQFVLSDRAGDNMVTAEMTKSCR